jgi:hypothetical protein
LPLRIPRRLLPLSLLAALSPTLRSYDHVFAPEVTNAAIYSACIADLLKKALDGFNVTIFACVVAVAGGCVVSSVDSLCAQLPMLVDGRLRIFRHADRPTPRQSSLSRALSRRLFALRSYGQTGSGKTFTMMQGADSAHSDEATLGITPRLIRDLFE